MSSSCSIRQYESSTAHEFDVIPVLESKLEFENAEKIVTTEDVIGILIGLRRSMGLEDLDGDEEEYIQTLEEILRIGERVGIPEGINSRALEALEKHIEMGFNIS